MSLCACGCGREAKKGHRFFGRECYDKWRREHPEFVSSNHGGYAKGKDHCNYVERVSVFCKYCGKKHELTPYYAKRFVFCNMNCYTAWRREHPKENPFYGQDKSGVNSPVWKGGLWKYERDKYKMEEAVWRKAVFERDNYTCQLCGVRGGPLQAHHIFPFNDFVETRFDVDKGVTLCKREHLAIKGKELKWVKLFLLVVEGVNTNGSQSNTDKQLGIGISEGDLESSRSFEPANEHSTGHAQKGY